MVSCISKVGNVLLLSLSPHLRSLLLFVDEVIS